MNDDDYVDVDEDDEVIEEPPAEPDKPTVTISKIVSVDAKQNLGNGRRFAVKSNQSGIRISYTKKLNSRSYYASTETKSVTIPHDVFDQVYDILTAVREAKDSE